MKRSTINWYESEILIKHKSPEEPTTADGVAEYLDQVEDYAHAVLKDIGIDTPTIPLSLEHRLALHNPEYFEETADGSVAVSLLENVTFLKRLLALESPTRNQVNCMLWMMAQISALTSMPHLGSAKIKQGKAAEKHRANRLRDTEIKKRRDKGEKISVLATRFELSERRILKILEE